DSSTMPASRVVTTVHDREFLFIVTYGRSGSTLLQGILNSIDGYQIRGENGNIPYHIYKYCRTAELQKAKRPKATSPDAPWYGIADYDSEEARTSARTFIVDTVLHPRPSARVVGFKEIRW